MRAICIFRAFWRSFIATAVGYRGDLISGHSFKTDDEPTPDNVHVLKCETCAHCEVMWTWGTLAHVK